MELDKYLTAADLRGQAMYYVGLRFGNFFLFFVISFIFYYIFVRKTELPYLQQQVRGHNSVASIAKGYRSGITSSGKGYHCVGNNCKGGDCHGEECEGGWCYGTGCHAGDCYGLNCVPGKCRDPYCNQKKQDMGDCEPLCYNGKAYHNYKSNDYKYKKKFPKNTYLNPISECSNKYISNLIKNKKKTWNFNKKSATFFKTGKKTIDEINNPPVRQAGEHLTIIDERNVYTSDPYLYQNNNCEWCADIKGHDICSSYIPFDIGKGKVKWEQDNDTKCKLYNKVTGEKKECGSTSKQKMIIKYAKDQIKKILSNRRLNTAQKYYEIEKIRGDEYEYYCFDIVKSFLDKKQGIRKPDSEYKEKDIGCSRIMFPKCLPIKNFNNISTCKSRVYRYAKFKKDSFDIDDNPVKTEYFKPVQYFEYLPDELDTFEKPRQARPSNYKQIPTNINKASYSHGYQSIYSTFTHHLPIFDSIDGNDYIYKCFWCDKECRVKNQCLPKNDKGQLEKCNDGKYEHYMVKMQDDNGNVYSKCIKCDKFCPKFIERKRKKYNSKFIFNIIFICVLIILIIILFI